MIEQPGTGCTETPNRRVAALALVVALGTAATTALAPHAVQAGLGTGVCGTLPSGTTQWDSVGSPYRICAGGVTVASGSTLDLNAGAGAVAVVAQGTGGLTVAGGTVTTQLTSTASGVAFSGTSASAGSWQGIGMALPSGGSNSGSLTLAYTTISDAVSAVSATSAAAVSLSNDTMSATSADGISVDCGYAGGSASITSTSVDHAAHSGISIAHCSPKLTANTVTASGVGADPWPAIDLVDVTVSLGPSNDVDGNIGAANGLDLMTMSGVISSGFTWISPSNSTQVHPLGYVSLGLDVQSTGTVTIPRGAVVKGAWMRQGNSPPPPTLLLDGATLDGSQGGATFTSVTDNSVGLSMCPSSFASTTAQTCASNPTDTALAFHDLNGTSANGVLSNDTVRQSVNGIAFGSSATTTFGGAAVGLSIQGCTLVGALEQTGSGSVSITGSTLTANSSSQAAVLDNGASLAIASSTFTGGIAADGGNTLSVVDSTVTQSYAPGIAATGVAQLTLHGNRLSNIGSGSDVGPQSPAIELGAETFSLGTAGTISGNTGYNNVLNAIVLDGTASSGFTWVTPTQSTSPIPLGYVAGNPNLDDGLTVDGNLTVPANSVVKAGVLEVLGTFDATAGGLVMTDLNDAGVSPPTCLMLGNPAAPGSSGSPQCQDLWADLQLSRSPGGAMHGNGAIDNATMTNVDVVIDSTATSTAGSTGFGLTLSNTTFRDVAGRNTPFSVDRSTGEEVTSDLGGASVTNSSVQSIDVSASTESVSLAHDTVAGVVGTNDETGTNPPYPGIQVAGTPGAPATHVSVLGNTVQASGLEQAPDYYNVTGYPPAIELFDVQASVGPGGDIAGNQGGGNALDAIELDGGTVTSDLSWITPFNSSQLHPLGYLGGVDGFAMRGAHTLTIPAGAIVKSGGGAYAFGGIDLYGTTVDARAGGAIFTSLLDNSVGIAVCPPPAGRQAPCPPVGQQGLVGNHSAWSGLSLHVDAASGARASADLVNAQVLWASITEDSGATSTISGDPYGLVMDHSTVSHGGITVTGSAVSITHSTVDHGFPLSTVAGNGNDAISLSDSTGNVVDDSRIINATGRGIGLSSASATIDRDLLRNDGLFRYVGVPMFDYAVDAHDSSSSASLSCDTVNNDGAGLDLEPGAAVTSSNLFGSASTQTNSSPYYDVEYPATVNNGSSIAPTLNAQGNWWGQAGGPTSGQISSPSTVDAGNALSSPSSCAPAIGATSLSVTVPSSPEADQPFNVTVTARDPSGGTFAAYGGTVHFNSADGTALPADYTFTSGDHGSHTFSMSFDTPGTQDITVTDDLNAIGGVAHVTVAAPALLAGAPTSATAGGDLPLGVTAYDSSGNVATGYTGTVHLTSTDGQAVLAEPYTFTASDGGTHTFYVELKTAGKQTVTATDNQGHSATTNSIVVEPVAATALLVAAPSSATAGAPITVTVTGKDPYGNTDPLARPTIHFSSTDADASLPADYTLTASDAGSHTFTVTMETPGPQTVTATAVGAPVSPGHSGSIAVSAPAPPPTNPPPPNPPPFHPQGVGAPSLVTASDGTQQLFWKGPGADLDEAWWNGAWNGPVDWSASNGWAASLTSAPSATIAADGSQLVFWQGPGGHLDEAWWNGHWNGPVDWTAANGWAPSMTSAPAVTMTPDGAQVIFWEGAGHLYEAWWNGQWNGPVDWTAAYGWAPSMTSAPAVTLTPDGKQVIFWQGAGHLYEVWWNGQWNGPVDWTAANGWSASMTSAPAVSIAPDGTQLIFWEGGGHLYEAWWKDHWNGPVDWTASKGWASGLLSAPTVRIASDGTQIIFWEGTGAHLVEVWWNGEWNGPVDWSA